MELPYHDWELLEAKDFGEAAYSYWIFKVTDNERTFFCGSVTWPNGHTEYLVANSQELLRGNLVRLGRQQQ